MSMRRHILRLRTPFTLPSKIDHTRPNPFLPTKDDRIKELEAENSRLNAETLRARLPPIRP